MDKLCEYRRRAFGIWGWKRRWASRSYTTARLTLAALIRTAYVRASARASAGSPRRRARLARTRTRRAMSCCSIRPQIGSSRRRRFASKGKNTPLGGASRFKGFIAATIAGGQRRASGGGASLAKALLVLEDGTAFKGRSSARPLGRTAKSSSARR